MHSITARDGGANDEVLQEVEEAIARAKASAGSAPAPVDTMPPVAEDVDLDDDDEETGAGTGGSDQLMTVRTGESQAEQIKSFLSSFLHL